MILISKKLVAASRPKSGFYIYRIRNKSALCVRYGKPPGSSTRLLEHYGALLLLEQHKGRLRSRISCDLLKDIVGHAVNR